MESSSILFQSQNQIQPIFNQYSNKELDFFKNQQINLNQEEQQQSALNNNQNLIFYILYIFLSYYEKQQISYKQNPSNYSITSQQNELYLQTEKFIQKQQPQIKSIENVQSANKKKQKKHLQICVNQQKNNNNNQFYFINCQLTKCNKDIQSEVLINISDYAYLNGEQALDRINFPTPYQDTEAQLIIQQTKTRSQGLILDHDEFHFKSRDLNEI
ncbi:hypothetical protein ABPG74_002865 [Tetrahymena malaccensis]